MMKRVESSMWLSSRIAWINLWRDFQSFPKLIEKSKKKSKIEKIATLLIRWINKELINLLVFSRLRLTRNNLRLSIGSSQRKIRWLGMPSSKLLKIINWDLLRHKGLKLRRKFILLKVIFKWFFRYFFKIQNWFLMSKSLCFLC